jgi:hypothetical protein
LLPSCAACLKILGASPTWNPLGPVAGKLYLYLLLVNQLYKIEIFRNFYTSFVRSSISSHVRYSSVLQTVQFEGHSFKLRMSPFSVEMCDSDMTGTHTQSEIMQYVLFKHIILSDKYRLPLPSASPPLMWGSRLSSYVHTTTKPTSLCKHGFVCTNYHSAPDDTAQFTQ